MTFAKGDYVVLTGAGWGVSDYPEKGTVVRVSGEKYGTPIFAGEPVQGIMGDYLHVWDDGGDKLWSGTLLSDVLKPGVRVEYRIPSRANEFAWGTYEGVCSLDGEGCRFVLVDGKHQNSQGFRRVDLDSVPKPDEALVQVAPGGTGTIASGPLMGIPVVQREDGKWGPLNKPQTFELEFTVDPMSNLAKMMFGEDAKGVSVSDAISPDHYQFGEPAGTWENVEAVRKLAETLIQESTEGVKVQEPALERRLKAMEGRIAWLEDRRIELMQYLGAAGGL